jgi:hypothetical protein
MAIIMYALHVNTCVYEVQMEPFFREFLKCYILIHYFTNGMHTCIKI